MNCSVERHITGHTHSAAAAAAAAAVELQEVAADNY